jgi:hypothetical protein
MRQLRKFRKICIYVHITCTIQQHVVLCESSASGCFHFIACTNRCMIAALLYFIFVYEVVTVRVSSLRSLFFATALSPIHAWLPTVSTKPGYGLQAVLLS